MATNVQLKRYNGSGWVEYYPKTSYFNLVDVPSTFAPAPHTHPGNVHYAFCDTNGATAAKVASAPDGEYIGGSLEDNTRLVVFFKYTNTALNPTLKLGDFTAGDMYLNTSKKVGTTEWESWPAGSYQMFIYNKNVNRWYLVGYRDITGAMQVANTTLELRKEN